jgi:hypothetical protein
MAKPAEITDKRTKGDVRRVRARLNKNCIFAGILNGTANAKNPHALKLKASQRQRSESPRLRAPDPTHSVKNK